jgi:ribosomal protein S18 acetylase RimI-like enzyme
MEEVSQILVIEEVSEETQEQAKYIVLSGLEESFGFLDDSFNKDLNEIYRIYIDAGNLFLIGKLQSEVICTGALIQEEVNIGRIVRMSVLKNYRGRGYARRILEEIEREAFNKGFNKIVLETTSSWNDAISFYKSHGYKEYDRNEFEIHMIKDLL